ncbi:outer membrane beta-barrel family protein [Arcticibacterium luteifluviistationis]|uniref:TonB-dependent receptor n=1 Tax=Arcticibacterium luteifluviistationis TaxID=1784714 RepID=A0A2Z4GC91_9BACT|nr:outer membrane beta-barrel family protein [Arcticibacterium luteifluviistationis]AWV98912.1 TonB-dependent receptor [Arcticibacterium luteifluviistationis]
MKNTTLLCIALCFACTFSKAQSSRINISGTLVDSSSTVLSFASVLLLMPEDSALVTYTLSDDDGAFSFKNLPARDYLVKATYISYLPHQILVKPGEDKDIDLGQILLKPISKELYEVVVKTARAPISIKGDTIEYDASKFKVPPGSSVEDLLRKLPGMEVDQDGNLRAQGESVQKVTVDGKRFFGGDTKMATKNLQADIIKKVQVFDDKSEQSKLTGIDDGNTEKTVNLELKEEAKKGGFGKVTAGLGTDSRAMASGNYNKFDSKNQFSLLGFGNNVNQSGMSYEDYEEFKGSNSYNWGNSGDFGFTRTTGYSNFFNTNDDSFSIPVGGNGDGFSKNAAGGINYNYNHKKDEVSANYFYNQTRQEVDAFQNRQNFITNSLSNQTTDQSNQNNFNGTHRVSLRAQKELDTLNTITFIGNGRIGNREVNYQSLQEIFKSDGFKANKSDIENSSERFSYALSSTLLFRHKFKKKGRNFSWSGGYDYSNNDSEDLQKSINEFYSSTDANDVIKSINQINATQNKADQLKSSVLWIEPFAKKFAWETFYNFNRSGSEVDRNVTDKFPDKPNETNLNLTRLYDNEILYNRVGTSVRYSHKGINFTTGLARVFYNIDGKLIGPPNIGDGIVDKDYQAWTPYSALSLRLRNNKSFRFNYTMGLNAPSSNDLQPIVDNSNPLYIREGNPDLLPEVTHQVSGNFNMYNPVNFVNLYLRAEYNYNVNQIIYNQNIDPETFITSTKPVNVTGGSSTNTYMYFGFPLKKTKATMGLNANVRFSTYLANINDVLNETKSDNYGIGANLNLTPIDWFTFYGYANWSIGNTSYSINNQQDLKIVSNYYNGEMNIKLPKDFFWSSNLNYRIYSNERLGFDQKVPIFNMSVYKLLGEKKKAEIRLSAYDIFKKNLGISQYASQNFISTREVQTLSRYFMLSFTYNMRGVSDKITRR